MSLINHDGNSLDCGKYVSDVFDANTGILWPCDDDNITQISNLSKGVYIRESHKNAGKKVMSVSTNILLIFYIRTSHLKNTALCFQEFTDMSKINHMKKVMEDMNILRKYFGVRQEVSDDIQTSISFIKYELQKSIENHIYCKKIKDKSFWLNGDGLKKLPIMNPMGKKS